ncbi:GNAT family N-acetyltransferase [Lactiplantibacillus mudanjiangensis]|uniref:GNAT family N-acetyltransferase [Lactobacillus sp.] n=1 Tax=Lactiplantibacillus mudanjiangensis TaxID=1296538 RepID=A0A660DYH9_9LACO|nr:GNAT family protein [Lactiplantibacillus mudanjiangensis]VDG21285.1 GNAT family N-acetyltransferase [Lactobacillus sp.] [Lactiplantibacillus mudanjiangensis]VDG22455.1 GNAT family N-acetyltransferase [Lactobacillus sp.] [Lactiplantibacillus mudanjiangensis]VDG27014.1 GNAT family N-acetyltransferase [Lactobacillus sp.] [Lactiplantibacillus mudanjiangensis]VDG32112.1 GNAT family N-acetyltransferase [Lactobacillus sp.] [Lactiplantibacillus mudanjiangensis]
MAKFEKYHPILTPHYTLDWLTQSRMNAILAFDQLTDPTATLLTTADAVNQIMRDIFHDQKLVWGITDRQNDQFIGQAGFDHLDSSPDQATLKVRLIPSAHTAPVLTELYPRLTDFATDELKRPHLSITLTATDQISVPILTALGYRIDPTMPTHFSLQ